MSSAYITSLYGELKSVITVSMFKINIELSPTIYHIIWSKIDISLWKAPWPYNIFCLNYILWFKLFHNILQSISHHHVSGSHWNVKLASCLSVASGSDRSREVALFGSDLGHVLQLARVGHVVAGLVLGQDLHDGTELQPPLLRRNPVAGRRKFKV